MSEIVIICINSVTGTHKTDIEVQTQRELTIEMIDDVMIVDD